MQPIEAADSVGDLVAVFGHLVGNEDGGTLHCSRANVHGRLQDGELELVGIQHLILGKP
jgi:hypothetical protein